MGVKLRLAASVLPVVAIGAMAATIIGGTLFTTHQYNSLLENQRNFYQQLQSNQEEQLKNQRDFYNKKLQDTLQVAAERPEVFQESLKQENAVPATDITGKTLDYTKGELIRDSSFVVSYPEPITVDPACLEGKINDPTQRRMAQDVGVAPRLVGRNHLTGFSVWANRAGTGYTRMDRDILNLGYSCQQR